MASIIPSVEIFSFSGGLSGDSSINIFAYTCPRNLRAVRNHKLSSKSWDRVRVWSRIKDCAVKVSDCDQKVGLYGQFSAPVKQDSSSANSSSNTSKEEDEEKQNYYVNTGYAIRTLRDELPELFQKELRFDIYRDDIVFKDPLYTFTGIENYKSIFWALRFNGKIFFQSLWVDIIRVCQPVENTIMVRWTVHGIPRVPWECRGRFDATSVYKLDKNGKIYEHRVNNIALNSPPKFQVIAVEELIQSLGCPPSTPKPTYFEFSPSPTKKVVSLLATLTASRYSK